MALPSRYGIDKKINSMEGLGAYENGGKGSGNFGHSGRPGMIGGSGDGGESSKESTKLQKRILDLEDRISQVEKDFEGNKRTKIDTLHTKRALMEQLSQARLDWAVAKRKEGEVKEKSEKGQDEGSGKGGSRKSVSIKDIPRAIMEGYEISSSRYNDPSKMSIVITPKGNLNLLYDGKDVVTIGGNERLILEASRLGLLESDKKMKSVNGGKGSGNFGHAGRPGEVRRFWKWKRWCF